MRQEVLTGIERRRCWSDAEKRSILAEVGVNGARVADVARRHDLTRQHIYQWRGEFRRRGESLAEETDFLPVEVAAVPTVTSAPTTTVTVEIVLANGRGVPGRFQYDFVIFSKLLSKGHHSIAIQFHPEFFYDLAPVKDRDLRKTSMHIHSDRSHANPPCCRWGVRGLCDIYGYALAAQTG